MVTVAVLVYKNFNYIKDCVDSILEQNYPEIQLIISDDGSDVFDKEMIEKYIHARKRDNMVVCDINPEYLVHTSVLADKYLQVPPIKSSNYYNTMLEHIRREHSITLLVRIRCS